MSFILSQSPELLIANLVLIVIGRMFSLPLMIVSIIVLFFLLYFYRKPTLHFYPNPNYLLSPAFGTVSRILPVQGNRVLITIFLSPFNVHAQYFPCDGKVIQQIYDNTGKFEIASDAYKSDDNEKMITTMESNKSIIKITQIAGILVRRISTPDYVDSQVYQGDYLGFIKFGSRVDIEFSLDTYQLLSNVYVGAVLEGPNSQIAHRV